MKKTLAIILLLATLTLTFSCSKDDFAPAGFRRISSDDADYRFYVPQEWTDDVKTGVTAAYVSDKDRSSVSFMGFELDSAVIRGEIVTGESSGTDDGTSADTSAETGKVSADDVSDIDSYWAYYESQFGTAFENLTYESKGENIIVSGIRSKKYVYTASVMGTEYKFLQTVTVKNGTVYIFTFTSSPDGYSGHLENVNAIIGFIEIK